MAVMAASLSLVGCDSGVSTSGRSAAYPASQAGDGEAREAGGAGRDRSPGDGGASAGDDVAGNSAGGDESSRQRKDRKPETLIWKRYRPFEHALLSGLSLQKGEMCQELGQASCIDKVHLTVLGGNEPYENGQYERAEAPTILTSVAVERIVLAACDKRLTLDKGLGASAVVFKHWPLTAGKVSEAQLKSQTQEIYRRLLARDATDAELGVAAELLGMMPAPDKLALSLCFMVGTQAESVFL
jgi:hypothetical protein